MTVWWCALILLCCVLNCVETSTPSPFLNSFRLTRSTRTRVQQLLQKYKLQQLGNVHYENRGQRLEHLPLLSTDFYSWLQLTDWERLYAALWDMQSYWTMLESKRKQLEREEKGKLGVKAIRSSLPQNIKYVQLDLRDLMSQVSSQMRYMKSSLTEATSPTIRTPVNPETNSKTEWDSRVEGYIILRDLDLYLTKLARDFLLLASNTHI